MQTMPAFLGNECGVLVHHRASLIPTESRSRVAHASRPSIGRTGPVASMLASASRDRELSLASFLRAAEITQSSFWRDAKTKSPRRPLPGRPLVRHNALRTRQMGDAIFLAVARDAEIKVRIAQFGRSADRAFVKWFGFTARLLCIAFAARRDFTAMPHFVNDFRTNKDQIIAQRSHHRHAIRIRADNKSEK